MTFDDVDNHPDFAALEEGVLQRWRDRDVFRRSVEAGAGAELRSFYDGPPTANGRPGVHHVEARVFKDVIPRYLSMKGFQVPRRAGWDCHGIPVELEVERALGFTGKPQIEAYGVAEFNARCRESVTRYVEEWKRLTERIGYWVDMEDAYWTMSTSYVESVWWSVKTMFDRGLLYEDFRVVPYCPRCGTALSDHEVSQGYAQTDDLSVFVRLPLISGPLAPGNEGVGGDPAGASLLIWTTLPWTVVFSTLAVIGPQISYVLARGGKAGDHLVVVAADLVATVLGSDAEVIRAVPVDELLGSRYRSPFEFIGPGTPSDPDGDPASVRFVVAGDFVTTTQGTGIVSTAPAYGEDDMRVAREANIPLVNYVDAAGKFDERVGPYAGLYVRDVNPRAVEDMAASGLLMDSGMYRHTYPFCWRCTTPLIYYAKPSWYISTTRFRDRLLAENQLVDWRPEHIREGRYGDWLSNNVDWALSRERYWGTPLPLWRCMQCRHVLAVGSMAELSELAGQDVSGTDPHRPFVDDITVPCPECDGATMKRVPEVMDAWYDSGSMPFAQFGYPHVPGSVEAFAEHFPADYTAEAIDQTRGWWYSLHAISTILFDQNSYRRALCLGHIVDINGRKMSKSIGNVLDPWELIGLYGVDALRWLLLVDGNPWQPRRVGEENVRQVARKLLLTIWNVYYFFVTYAGLSGWQPAGPSAKQAPRSLMDRYILAELAETVSEVDARMSDYDITRAGRRLHTFIDDLSNWYLRRCRSRFWAGESDGAPPPDDTVAAFETLYTCLTTVAGLLAPFTPFLADELHENLVRKVNPDAPDSVHLTRFPQPVVADADPELSEAMQVARRLVTLGREARSTAGVPVRCPLPQAIVTVPAQSPSLADLLTEVVAVELNVKQIRLAENSGGDSIVKYTLRPNYRALGPLFGRRTPLVAAAVERADAATVALALRTEGSCTIMLDDEALSLGPETVQVVEEPVTGWQISAGDGYSVALDLELSRELKLEWLARELIRTLNELRKKQGLAITDRVRLELSVRDDPQGEVVSMLAAHSAWIGREVLALEVRSDGPSSPAGEELTIGDGLVDAVLHPVG